MITDSPPATAALACEDISLGYDGQTVVHHAAITLQPGCVTALVGPNGSGKSTLLRSLARLHEPESGSIRVRPDPVDGDAPGGVDPVDASVLHPKQFARLVTLLTQSRPTPSGVRVRDVVTYGRHPYRGRFGSGDADGPQIVERAMQQTGVAPMSDRPVDELSGGELQRVWLATCLAQDTGVVLLDEPTTYLDLRYQIETLDIVRDLADLHGVAIGVVLHDLDQAAALADRLVLIHCGVIRAEGRPVDVLAGDLLTEVYGIRIDVTCGADGRIRTQPVGRHINRSV